LKELRKVFQEMKGFTISSYSQEKLFRPIGGVKPNKIEHYIKESESHRYTDVPTDSLATQHELLS